MAYRQVKQTVFFGRETPVAREDVDNLVPSIEEDTEMGEDFPIITSDLLNDANNIDDMDNISDADDADDEGDHPPPSPSPKHKSVRPRKRTRASADTADELSSASSLPKRARKTTAPLKPKRSARISAQLAADSLAKESGADTKPTKLTRPCAATKSKPVVSDRTWEVEKIVDSQVDADTLEQFYHVKWKGFPAKDNTWEPKKNLASCRQTIRAYEKAKVTRKKR
ncbi:hypothetical protein G7046_g2191 [Stylonectria norvegica]|nr:hypothetical protein G7046_g2191 [Stylonectria norvegica]